MRVPKIYKKLCQGCGNCEAICPEVFEVKEDAISHVITDDFRGLEGCIEAAVENCPEDALTYEEEDGEKK
jgi:ferredoxin